MQILKPGSQFKLRMHRLSLSGALLSRRWGENGGWGPFPAGKWQSFQAAEISETIKRDFFLSFFYIPESFVHQEMCSGDIEGNYCICLLLLYNCDLKAQDNLTQKEASCLMGVKYFCKREKQPRQVQLFKVPLPQSKQPETLMLPFLTTAVFNDPFDFK